MKQFKCPECNKVIDYVILDQTTRMKFKLYIDNGGIYQQDYLEDIGTDREVVVMCPACYKRIFNSVLEAFKYMERDNLLD